MSKYDAYSLVVLGILFGVVGLALATVCTVTVFGACVQTLEVQQLGFSGAGTIIALIGAALFILGIVLLVKEKEPLHLMPGQSSQSRFTIASSHALGCPVCGLLMTWIAPEEKWYCPNCREYRS
jgi:membrane-bound ClpP family serine protease